MMWQYEQLFKLSFIFYFLSAAIFWAFFITQKNKIGIFGFVLGFTGFLMHSTILILRAIALGYAPVSNLYESLSFFAWIIMLVYSLAENKQRSWVNGAFVLPLVVLLMGYALILDSRIRALVPALQSPWLGIHASLCFLSYGCFLLAFCFGVMYLWQEQEVKSKKLDGFFFRLPALGLVDRLGYRAVGFGFIFLTLGIISGSLWAHRAWGAFWSWDPKETWSLIVWLVYVVYLHGRLMQGWRGRKSAYIAILGFLAVLFTYFGVSFLLSGLHSYF
jgi:cytochrome c-type biogenesis protein CcsB